MQIILNFKKKAIVREEVAGFFIFFCNLVRKNGKGGDKLQAGLVSFLTDQTGVRTGYF